MSHENFPKIMMNKQEQQQFFEEIIEQHKGIMFKVARTYCLDEVDRQDLIQEMIIQIWQSTPKYNKQYKISTWLYRISLNVAISFYRKRHQEQVNLVCWMIKQLKYPSMINRRMNCN